MDAQGLKIELQPGMVWSIPKNTVHSFHTDQSELNVIAYHPDTDPCWFQTFFLVQELKMFGGSSRISSSAHLMIAAF